jgi:hypothetical protein
VIEQVLADPVESGCQIIHFTADRFLEWLQSCLLLLIAGQYVLVGIQRR